MTPAEQAEWQFLKPVADVREILRIEIDPAPEDGADDVTAGGDEYAMGFIAGWWLAASFAYRGK
jgi:hypothetical protein